MNFYLRARALEPLARVQLGNGGRKAAVVEAVEMADDGWEEYGPIIFAHNPLIFTHDPLQDDLPDEALDELEESDDSLMKSLAERAVTGIRSHISEAFETAVNFGLADLDGLLECLFISVVTHPDIADWLDEQPDRLSDRINSDLDERPRKLH